MNNKKLPLTFIPPVAVSLATAALIPLNLFVVPFPEWLCAAGCLLSAGFLVFMWVRGSSRVLTKIAVSALTALLSCACLFLSFCNPYWSSCVFRGGPPDAQNYDAALTSGEALDDLELAMRLLKKLHPLLLNGVPDETRAEYERARRELSELDSVDVNTLARCVERVFSTLHDAHTHISLNYSDRFMKYRYARNAAGDEPVAVNGVPIEDIFAANADLLSYEYPEYGILQLSGYLTSMGGLDYLGIPVDGGVTYTYLTPGGETVYIRAEPEDFLLYDDYAAFNRLDETSGDRPFVSYDIYPEHSAAVLTLTACIYNDEYISCLDAMFSEVCELGIKNVIVDLRGNGGGNSLVADEFIRHLDVDAYKTWGCDWRLGPFLIDCPRQTVVNEGRDVPGFDGGVYVLTSVGTFSSAMDFAMLIKDNGLGTIVGEAPGNDPDGCGDVSYFALRNSGLYLQISTKHWRRVDDIPGPILPDYPCDPRDALETALSLCG